ncbi:hypothetical protein [Flavobacterium sp. HJJ]|nr:hypothetical protein [Flavobacterium sp. HJJ]
MKNIKIAFTWTMPQEDFESKFKIPKEAIQLVKTITKVAAN